MTMCIAIAISHWWSCLLTIIMYCHKLYSSHYYFIIDQTRQFISCQVNTQRKEKCFQGLPYAAQLELFKLNELYSLACIKT